MSIVNFSIPRTLEQKVKQTVKEKGFMSKAEFFRFTAIKYIDEASKLPLDDNPRIAYLTSALEDLLKRKFKRGKLPSVEKQLSKLAEL